MCLKRYNIIPARVAIESIDVSDFLLGGKIISVNEDGTYKYMFCSPLLSGIYLKKIKKIEEERSSFSKDSLNIIGFMNKLIGIINENYTQTELYSIVDTSSIKKTMRQYGIFCQGRKPGDLLQYNTNKYPWSITQSPKKYYSKRQMRQNNTYQLFREMLHKEYHLPDIKKDKNTVNIKDMQMLYACDTSLYTVRLVWENVSIRKKYVIICDIKKTSSGFVLTGINKPYRGYRQYVKENNERFVP